MHRHLIHRTSPQWVILLMVSIMTSQLFFQASFAHGADKNLVKPPKTKMSVGVPIETESSKSKGWFSRNKWWVALGVVLLGGGVAAAAGGGSSGGGSGDGGNSEIPEDNDSGAYTFEW